MSRTAVARSLVGLTLPLVCLVVWNCLPGRHAADETLWVATTVGAETRWAEVEAFLPAGRGPHPAVLLLHGVEGAHRNHRSRSRMARELADAGFATFVVHYFDVCPYEDLWLFAGEQLDLTAIEDRCRQDAELWVQATLAALSSVAARGDIDRQRIALDGYSLGGFVALAVTEQAVRHAHIADPAALVIHWGSLFETTSVTAGFPPALFIHGERDPIVSLQAAEAACAAMTAAGAEAELLLIPGAGHVARTVESDEAVLEFLKARLRRRDVHPEFAWTEHDAALSAALLQAPFP